MKLLELMFTETNNNDTTSEVVLYHYAHSREPELILDPKKFGSSFYTKRDKQLSEVPRLFFYTNPSEKEKLFDSSDGLYRVIVDKSRIYNLGQDPDGLKQRFVTFPGGPTDFDLLLRYVSGWNLETTGHGKSSASGWVKGPGVYDGMMYRTPKFVVVLWFLPVVGTLIPESERIALETD